MKICEIGMNNKELAMNEVSVPYMLKMVERGLKRIVDTAALGGVEKPLPASEPPRAID
jgi:hypothetical protein